MSRAIKQSEAMIPELKFGIPAKLVSLWPVLAPILVAIVLILTRAYYGRVGFLYEGALTVLAFLSYTSAAVLLVTNVFMKERLLARIGLYTVALGACLNLSGWMIRWIEAGEAEGWLEGINGVWRYFPLDNLYALTLGFCFGSAITTLAIMRKPKYEFIGALAMPIVVVILALCMMLGNQINTLPPILDSYWRPIHVSIATIGYGVCLVSFGLAFAYLLKDGVRSEAIAIAVLLYGVLIYTTVGRYGVPVYAEYGASAFIGGSSLPLRVTLPFVGPMMLLGLIVVLASLAVFIYEWVNRNEKLNKFGWNLFRGAAGVQALVLVLIFFQLASIDNLGARVPEREIPQFGQWLVTQSKNTEIPPEQYHAVAQQWITRNSSELTVNPKSNPVELGGMIGLFVALLMISLFAWRRADVISAMPSLQAIDGMLYRTVGIAFSMLAMLLITGAVWANESWGRYWGWDPKEVGALVAWMAYAGFLHTRIAHGWRGRRSAYFALLGFVLVIFTWLGVSYLLPGLHSYA